MRVLSTAAGAARHGVGALAEAAVVVAIGAALVFGAAVLTRSDPAGAADVYAAKGGGGGGNFTATIAIADASKVAASADGAVSGDVTFAVTQSRISDEVMWVTNRCFDAAGTQVSRLDLPVQWGTWESLEGIAGPFATAGASCAAYATWKPWTDRAITDALDYPVQY